MFTTLRAHLEGGYIPAHFDNEMAFGHHTEHLLTLIAPRLFSFVLALTRPRAAARSRCSTSPARRSGRSRKMSTGGARPDLSAVARVSFRLPPGSMIVMDSGRFLHRVTPVTGTVKRWTACSFMAKTPERRGELLLGLTLDEEGRLAEVPAYFDGLIDAFRRGKPGRFVHLGHWHKPDEAQRGDAGEFLRAQRRLDDVLIGMAGLADGQAVLDVGCGLGGTLETIDRQRRGMRLVGLNIDQRQLELCRTLTPAPGNSLTWTVGDACDLPYADASFDRLLSIEAMFHFRARGRFFAEAARVLRPGGMLVASDIVVAPDAGRLPAPRFAIEAMLVDGYGPWPDVFPEGWRPPDARRGGRTALH